MLYLIHSFSFYFSSSRSLNNMHTINSPSGYCLFPHVSVLPLSLATCLPFSLSSFGINLSTFFSFSSLPPFYLPTFLPFLSVSLSLYPFPPLPFSFFRSLSVSLSPVLLFPINISPFLSVALSPFLPCTFLLFSLLHIIPFSLFPFLSLSPLLLFSHYSLLSFYLSSVSLALCLPFPLSLSLYYLSHFLSFSLSPLFYLSLFLPLFKVLPIIFYIFLILPVSFPPFF